MKSENDDEFLRLKQVLEIIPVGKSTWYRGMKAGAYPEPIKLGKRAVGWSRNQIRHLVLQIKETPAE